MPDLLQRNFSDQPSLGLGSGLVRLSLATLAAWLLAWGGLYFWGKSITSSLQALSERESALLQEESSSLVAEAKATARRLASLQTRLQNHSAPSRLLDLLEVLTNPRMQVLSLTLPSIESGEASIRGETDGLGTLAAALAGWNQQKEVRSAAVPELSRREGRVSFRAELKLEPALFVGRGL